MDRKKINLLKAIFEISLIIAVVIGLSRVLMLKSEDGYDQLQSFYKQPKNSIDTIFLGSSKMYCQVDTGILWDEYGIAAYDLGGAEATSWNGYYFLKEALKTQRPEVIFFDAGIIGNMPEVEYQRDKWAMTNNYGMKWNSNRIAQLRENTEDYETFRRLVFPLDTMHSRYSELTKTDFVDVNNDITYKGFDYRDAITPLEKPNLSGIIAETPISARQEEFLVKMMEYSKEMNVPFVVIIAPYAVTEEEQKIFNYIGKICQENDTPFVNFNNMYDELGLDFGCDFAEELHLNFSGSKKFTSYLGRYVKDNYQVVDHRGDKQYASWEQDALISRQNRIAYELNNESDLEKIAEMLDNPYYIVFDVDDMAELRVYDNCEKVLYGGGMEPYKSIIYDGNARIIVKRDGETSYININRETYKVGWPWTRKIVYDKVLDKVVMNRSFYEE